MGVGLTCHVSYASVKKKDACERSTYRQVTMPVYLWVYFKPGPEVEVGGILFLGGKVSTFLLRNVRNGEKKHPILFNLTLKNYPSPFFQGPPYGPAYVILSYLILFRDGSGVRNRGGGVTPIKTENQKHKICINLPFLRDGQLPLPLDSPSLDPPLSIS